MSDCGCHIEARNAAERKTLRIVLLINVLMFFMEVITGILAHSTALIADSLDMLADALVYGLSLYAVGRSPRHKTRAAGLSGLFQMTLAVLILGDVIRRFVSGSAPEADWMMAIALLGLVANGYCLYLIAKHRQGEVHMRASWIFTQNDVIANVSVIIAGGLVALFRSPYPDLIVGFGIASLVLWGGIRIVRDARQAVMNTPVE
ncbi:cation diffusion facilitator family transporter [Thermosynechococcus sp. QKsg1]|uniref:cation diffusion facilitator family transporter n=1 Tax=unclassified Thermosynechococcus TaxID=2622553 RepID=UPI00122E1583|nr:MULTISPECIES: cation diffusion facilitator family transporter [unclassified Thermosynechococcus]QEQ01350.1 cation transporter [Thermosynechococcus sp. CL-1]WJI23195.1 cation diffusion facilitator family transporter [Thermosynechococcus sp. B0]WKT82797.1 cation diffusion facilitator family transporter [Thermosynechococcus sp. HY596]WNC61924.1 cation diffusion facilitator family transporter [Thermosynechococcus sp. HY591]WNC64478.1 cation diffusion facilitator family transporter [Thermosynech